MKTPFELTLVVTHNCNLNCVYCYEHNKSKSEDMTLSTAQDVITRYMTSGDNNNIRIGFIGGEPLLKFNLIRDICEWFWSKRWAKDSLFYATTNGTIMTESMKHWFEEHRKHFWLGLSLDGTKQTHDRNRSNSFSKIDINFFLRNWPDQPIKMTLSDRNIDTIAEDVMFIHGLGFKITGGNFAEGIEMDDFAEKCKTIAKQYDALVTYYLKHQELESPFFQLPFSECESHRLANQKRCGTGENMAVVDYDGTTYPCTYFSPVSMDKKQLKEIQKIDFHDHKRFIDYDCRQNCYLYPICNGCYGDNYSLTGDISKRSTQKCQLFKLRVLAAYKYTMLRLHKKLEHATAISPKDAKTIVALQKIEQMFNL